MTISPFQFPCRQCRCAPVQHEGEICKACDRKPPMLFDPTNGLNLQPDQPTDPADWRPVAGTPTVIADELRWRYDPWTGVRRPVGEVALDPSGLKIMAPARLADRRATEIPPEQDVIVDRRRRATNPKSAAAATRIPLWLCSPIAKIHWALAQFAGLTKYGAWNWRVAGVRYSEYISAIERHLAGILSGETVDPVDGTDHLGNIMACCAIILEAREAKLLTDDRPPRIDHRPTIAVGEALLTQLREQYKDADPRHYTIADSVSGDTLSPSTEGDNHVAAARPVPPTGHADGARSQDREAGREAR